MKKEYIFQIIILAVIVFINASCKKETLAPPLNRPPVADAGKDISIVLFSNEVRLRGQVTDPNRGNTLRTTWTKIAGPACEIISPQSPSTLVSNLVEGEYLFELLVSDNHGATDKDTVAVKTTQLSSFTGQVNFFNLSWTCPMGCSINIPNIYSYIPPGTSTRVFIGVNQVGWQEVIHESLYGTLNSIYYYGIDYNNFYVFTDFEFSTNVDIKILF